MSPINIQLNSGGYLTMRHIGRRLFGGGEPRAARTNPPSPSPSPTTAVLPVIETTGLARSFGAVPALRGIDLSVPQGAVFALLGANGAGKTTFIKVLLNIIAPTRGSARILGIDSRRIGPELLARIGYVSENQVLPRKLRVAHFFDYLRDCYPSWDRDLERELREQMGLPPSRKIGALSHGMRMKMILACALPYRPRLLILDEPLSGLDPLARDEVIAGFMRRAGQTTLLISSHELDEVERFATDVAILHRGCLLFAGTVGAFGEHARPLLGQGARAKAASPSLRDNFVAVVRSAGAVPGAPAESFD